MFSFDQPSLRLQSEAGQHPNLRLIGRKLEQTTAESLGFRKIARLQRQPRAMAQNIGRIRGYPPGTPGDQPRAGQPPELMQGNGQKQQKLFMS